MTEFVDTYAMVSARPEVTPLLQEIAQNMSVPVAMVSRLDSGELVLGTNVDVEQARNLLIDMLLQLEDPVLLDS